MRTTRENTMKDNDLTCANLRKLIEELDTNFEADIQQALDANTKTVLDKLIQWTVDETLKAVGNGKVYDLVKRLQKEATADALDILKAKWRKVREDAKELQKILAERGEE